MKRERRPERKAPARREDDRRRGTADRKAQPKRDAGTKRGAQPKREAPARREAPAKREAPEMPEDLLIGRNPVAELLKAGRSVDKLIVQEGAGGSMGKIVALAKEAGVRIEYVDKAKLDKICGTGAHQGVAARTAPADYADFDELVKGLAAREGDALVLLLDGIEDPHNLGAIIRTCECAGADAVVITKNRSCGLNATAAKTSAGAVEYLPCARVTNMVRAVEELQEAGFWVFAADMDGTDLWDKELKGKLALVIGNEGKGVSRLVREKCDFAVSIPMTGHLDSLNASNAAAVIVYEVMRQRRA